MKFNNLFFSIVLLLAVTRGYADRPLPETPTEGEVYVVDFYDGRETAGNKYLEGLAAENKIEILAVLGQIGDVIIKSKEREVLEIRQHFSVKVVEEDDDMEVMGWVDEIQPDDIRDGARNLVENTPYGINMVKAADLPNLPTDKSWKRICVIDTGYDNSHPDLPTLDTAADGFSPYSEDQKWYEDGDGHGTHCAGTIGAIGNNNVGINSVMNTYGSGFENFFISKGLRNKGKGSMATVMSAMNKCKEKGADVISVSLGSKGRSRSFSDAIKSLWKQGVLFIAAAGNHSNGRHTYPASYEHVMSVAAVNSNKVKASFSQFNDQVEISGPGVAVLSTYKGGFYRSMSGTSMACPHVTGVAGLVWSHFPDCKPMQIRYALSRTAVPSGNQSRCNVNYGHGVVDAKAAYDFLEAHPCNSWPSNYIDPNFVQSGCYVSADATDWPTASPTASPIASPGPTSAPSTLELTPLGLCTTKFCPWKTTGECDEIRNCVPTPAPTGAPTFSPTPAPTNNPHVTATQYGALKLWVVTSSDKKYTWAVGDDRKSYVLYPNISAGERRVWAFRLMAITVSGNGDHVWSLNQWHSVYYRSGVNGTWRRDGGRLISIDAADDGSVWGANHNGHVFYKSRFGAGWQAKNAPNAIKSIAVSGDGKHQWAVGRNHKVYYKSGVGSSGSWTEKEAPPYVNQISVNQDGNHLWAVDHSSVIYYRKGLSGSWTAVSEGALQISVAAEGNYFLGRKHDNTVWKFEGNLDEL